MTIFSIFISILILFQTFNVQSKQLTKNPVCDVSFFEKHVQTFIIFFTFYIIVDVYSNLSHHILIIFSLMVIGVLK
jgi:hypothetical protein